MDWGTGLLIGSQLVGSLYGASQNRSNREQAVQNAQQQAEAEYQNYLNNYNAVKDYNARVSGASSANSAAARAVAQANENARAATAKKQGAILEKYTKQRIKALQPYTDVALKLLPQMQQTYSSSMDGQQQMLKQLLGPQSIAKMNGSIPAGAVPLLLPSYMKGAANG